jgi:hypothetical protein
VALVKRQLSEMLQEGRSSGAGKRISIKPKNEEDLIENNLEDSLREYRPGSPKTRKRNNSESKKGRRLKDEEENR